MNRIDDVLRDFKEFGYIEELKQIGSIKEAYERIALIVSKVNTLKSDLSELSPDEQLYLEYGLQQMGINLGLCPDFYIFYSNKYGKFHHCCRLEGNKRTYCRGQKEKCRTLKP